MNVSTASAAWTELGVNGNNAPGIGSTVATNVTVGGAGRYILVDVTSAIQGWVASPAHPTTAS